MSNVMIKDLPNNDKPRERLIELGERNVSNEDLISIILKTGTKDKSVKDLSNLVLSNFSDITEMRNIKLNTITKINGIGKVKALELIAAIELGRRVYKDKLESNQKLTTSKAVYEYFKDLKDLKQEHFYAVYLDNKKRIIDKKLLYIGSLNGSVAHPREIFKNAYLSSASSIICIHNHPSGDPNPSKEDIMFTKNLKEIGKFQNIPVVDHIIIGNNNYYSFFEEGI